MAGKCLCSRDGEVFIFPGRGKRKWRALVMDHPDRMDGEGSLWLRNRMAVDQGLCQAVSL